MGGITVGELLDFLIEQPKDAKVLVCDDSLTPVNDSFVVTDVLYIDSNRTEMKNVIILYDSER